MFILHNPRKKLFLCLNVCKFISNGNKYSSQTLHRTSSTWSDSEPIDYLAYLIEKYVICWKIVGVFTNYSKKLYMAGNCDMHDYITLILEYLQILIRFCMYIFDMWYEYRYYVTLILTDSNKILHVQCTYLICMQIFYNIAWIMIFYFNSMQPIFKIYVII